jgi:hypothetical protein
LEEAEFATGRSEGSRSARKGAPVDRMLILGCRQLRSPNHLSSRRHGGSYDEIDSMG